MTYNVGFFLICAFVGALIIVVFLIFGMCRRASTPELDVIKSHLIFHDPSFEFQLLRTMDKSVVQMADINECLKVAHKIKDGDFESWYQEWFNLAQRIYEQAEKYVLDGHLISARSALLRACNYYRAAGFYLHGNVADHRIVDLSKKSCLCFRQAMRYMDHAAQVIKIPFESTILPGYFYSVDNQRRPLLIIQTGFDGTQEELYVYVCAALQRGYHVLTFEGPGQGSVLHEQKLYFRPDWEVVIKAVADVAVKLPSVDEDLLILYGLSMGGYFVARGASGEHRIKILIANGGIYDFFEGINQVFHLCDCVGDDARNFMDLHAPQLNSVIYAMMEKNTNIRWSMQHGMYSFNVSSPVELLCAYTQYNVRNLVQNITCAALICDSEQELVTLRGQSKRLYDRLDCSKTYLKFLAYDAAEFHCQSGALMTSNEQIFNWLDQTVHQLRFE